MILEVTLPSTEEMEAHLSPFLEVRLCFSSTSPSFQFFRLRDDHPSIQFFEPWQEDRQPYRPDWAEDDRGLGFISRNDEEEEQSSMHHKPYDNRNFTEGSYNGLEASYHNIKSHSAPTQDWEHTNGQDYCMYVLR